MPYKCVSKASHFGNFKIICWLGNYFAEVLCVYDILLTVFKIFHFSNESGEDTGTKRKRVVSSGSSSDTGSE